MDRRARTVLIGARRLLRDGWCQSALPRKSNGSPFDPGSDLARSWSLLGAIDCASEKIGEPSTQSVCEASRALSPADSEDAWSPSVADSRRALLRALNDGPGATKEQIMDGLEQALQRLTAATT